MNQFTQQSGIDLNHYEIDPTDLKRLWQNASVALVDIREEQEIAQGTLQGALFAPLSKLRALEEMKVNPLIACSLPKDGRPLYLFCASGQRVIEAAAILGRHYQEVYPLRWGWQQLMSFGFPLRASLR